MPTTDLQIQMHTYASDFVPHLTASGILGDTLGASTGAVGSSPAALKCYQETSRFRCMHENASDFVPQLTPSGGIGRLLGSLHGHPWRLSGGHEMPTTDLQFQMHTYAARGQRLANGPPRLIPVIFGLRLLWPEGPQGPGD